MKTWDEMEPCERDAWVAEHVMVWTLADRRQMGWGDGPAVWLTGEPFDDEHSNPTHQEPQFTTDAAADYLVLVRVRETWMNVEAANAEGGEHYRKLRALFHRHLVVTIWGNRGEQRSLPYCEWVDRECRYEPGDFAHAAYLAITNPRT